MKNKELIIKKTEKKKRVEKLSKTDKIEKPSKIEKTNKTEKTSKIVKKEKTCKSNKIEKTSKTNKIEKINKIKKMKGGNDFADLGSSIGYTITNGFKCAVSMVKEIGSLLNVGKDFKDAVNPDMSNATPGNSIYTAGPTSSLPDVSGM
jgi:beta-N-acetylglucosaminidase